MRSAVVLLLVALSGARAQLLAQQPAYYPQQQQALAYPQQLPYGQQQLPYGQQQPLPQQQPLSAFQLSQISTLGGVTPFEVAQTIQQAQHQPWALADLSHAIGVEPLQLHQLVQQANALPQTGQDIFQLAQQATYAPWTGVPQQAGLPFPQQAYPQLPYAQQPYPQQPLPQQPYGPQAPLSAFQLSQIASLAAITPFQVAQTIQQAQQQPWALADLAATIAVDPFQLQQLVQQANLLAQTGQDIYQVAQQATYGAAPLAGAYRPFAQQQPQQPFYQAAPIYQPQPIVQAPYIPPAVHANILAQQPQLIQRPISPRFAPQLARVQPQYVGQQPQQQGGLIQGVQSFFQTLGL